MEDTRYRPSIDDVREVIHQYSMMSSRGIDEFTARIELDIVDYLMAKGGVVSRSVLYKELPYKQKALYAALRLMVLSGTIDMRKDEVVLL